jgi:hypothetical protein
MHEVLLSPYPAEQEKQAVTLQVAHPFEQDKISIDKRRNPTRVNRFIFYFIILMYKLLNISSLLVKKLNKI